MVIELTYGITLFSQQLYLAYCESEYDSPAGPPTWAGFPSYSALKKSALRVIFSLPAALSPSSCGVIGWSDYERGGRGSPVVSRARFYGLVPVVGALPGCGTSDQCSQIWVLGFLDSFLCAPLVGEVLSKCDADLLLLAGHGGEVEKQQGECSAKEPFLVGRGDEEEQRSDVSSMASTKA
jgi:hypothetical protein